MYRRLLPMRTFTTHNNEQQRELPTSPKGAESLPLSLSLPLPLSLFHSQYHCHSDPLFTPIREELPRQETPTSHSHSRGSSQDRGAIKPLPLRLPNTHSQHSHSLPALPLSLSHSLSLSSTPNTTPTPTSYPLFTPTPKYLCQLCLQHYQLPS
jgi:hypothetical protein